MALKPGEVVERYEIEAILGSGGMATVYRARHTVLGSQHALKVLSAELVEDEELRERFLAEGRIQAQLKHRALAAVTDIVVAPGVAGLVQDLIDGPTLDEFIERVARPLTAPELVAIMLPVVEGVAFAHSKGVLHRDLKPSNIILGGRGEGSLRPVVVDFGIAKIADEGDVQHRSKRKTRTGARMGTPGYMSPEQVKGSAQLDSRSDVFALGVVLYELATGEMPFDAESEFEIMQKVVEGDRPPIAGRTHPSIPQPLAALIERSLATAPGSRPNSAADLADALRSAATPHDAAWAAHYAEQIERSQDSSSARSLAAEIEDRFPELSERASVRADKLARIEERQSVEEILQQIADESSEETLALLVQRATALWPRSTETVVRRAEQRRAEIRSRALAPALDAIQQAQTEAALDRVEEALTRCRAEFGERFVTEIAPAIHRRRQALAETHAWMVAERQQSAERVERIRLGLEEERRRREAGLCVKCGEPRGLFRGTFSSKVVCSKCEI